MPRDPRPSHRQRDTYNQRQEQELVKGQRRRLEAMLLRQDQQARSQVFDKILVLPELSAADIAALDEELKQAPEPEQRQLLARLSAYLQNHFGPSGQSPPETLPALLRLLSAFARGPREPGSQRRSGIALAGLNIAGLKLENLDLRGALLQNCSFEAARLPQLNLFAARLEQVALERADLRKADLTGATLIQTDLSQASLNQAELIAAELRQCDLRQASLQGAALRGIRLFDCDLRGANLEQASGLTYAQLLSSRIDAQTRLPEDLRSRQAKLIAAGRGE